MCVARYVYTCICMWISKQMGRGILSSTMLLNAKCASHHGSQDIGPRVRMLSGTWCTQVHRPDCARAGAQVPEIDCANSVMHTRT